MVRLLRTNSTWVKLAIVFIYSRDNQGQIISMTKTNIYFEDYHYTSTLLNKKDNISWSFVHITCDNKGKRGHIAKILEIKL